MNRCAAGRSAGHEVHSLRGTQEGNWQALEWRGLLRARPRGLLLLLRPRLCGRMDGRRIREAEGHTQRRKQPTEESGAQGRAVMASGDGQKGLQSPVDLARFTLWAVPGHPKRPRGWTATKGRSRIEAVSPIRWLQAEASQFREALAAIPEPDVRWDVLGARSFALRVLRLVLSEHTSPGRLAGATFVGIMIGISPFYGFHVIGALTAAQLFRLNKVVVWAGTNISLPIIAPIFAFASAQVGCWLLTGAGLPLTWERFREVGFGDALIYWTVGFPIVGSVVGATLALFVYRLALRRQD